MSLASKLLSAFAEEPVSKTFEKNGVEMPLLIRKISMADHDAINEKIGKLCSLDDQQRGILFAYEVFKVSLVNEDKTPAIKDNKEFESLKKGLGVDVFGELLQFVNSVSIPQAKEDEKKD